MARENPFEATKAKLAAVGVLAPEPSERVRVKLQPVIGKLAEAVGLVVGKGQNKLFLRGDAVVKIEYDPNQGDYDFAPMKDTEFVTWIERYLSFGVEVQQKDDDGEPTGKTSWKEKSIPSKTARLILDAPQFRDQLPRVVRKNRVRLPILRRPGKPGDLGVCELLPPGFDEESGVFTFPSAVEIDETQTIEAAVEFLLDLLSEFPLPLVSIERDGEKELRLCPRGMAACIAGMMAPFAEGLLGEQTLRCGFIYTANSQGSGKSLLAKIAIAPITGQAAGFTLDRDEQALRNRIDAVLLSGQGCLFFDNVKGFIQSHVIEALMTLPYWQGRAYHTQRIFTVKNETTIFISGNNATVSPDIHRRFLYVELQLETADPANRNISREIDDRWLVDPRNRGRILSALWALVRHWDSNGRPKAPTSIPGFKSWCDVIGGIVCSATDVSAGAIGNPLVQPDLSSAGDVETTHLKKLVELLVEDGFSTANAKPERFEFEPHEVIEIAMVNGLFDWFMPDLPEGKEVNEVLKQPERVKFGKLIVAKSGPHPKGMKYLVTREGKPSLWRFSFVGSGRHRRYLLELQ